MAPAALTTSKAVERRATAKYAHPNHLRHHRLVVPTPNTTHTRLPSDTVPLSGDSLGELVAACQRVARRDGTRGADTAIDLMRLIDVGSGPSVIPSLRRSATCGASA
jgi:hypothetical protein